MPAAISITLYGKDDEVLKTYERAIIPWGILKKATRLMQVINNQEATSPKRTKFVAWLQSLFWKQAEIETMSLEERQMQGISQFVVELFGNQFTVKDLESGADVGEIMAVFQAVMMRANATVKANPTMNQRQRKP